MVRETCERALREVGHEHRAGRRPPSKSPTCTDGRNPAWSALGKN